MDKRVELNWLLDFYGPLLTEHRQNLLRLYLEEDLTLQEIASQVGITRQGVYDAIFKAQTQLNGFEEQLSLLTRYRKIQAEIDACREVLKLVPETEEIKTALSILDNIERIEG